MPGPLRRRSQRFVQGDVRRIQSQPAMVARVGPCGFRQAPRWRGAPVAKQYGRTFEGPRRLFASKSSWSGVAGLKFKRFRQGNGFKRNHGKVRKTPRRFGCGRHLHGAAPCPSGHNFRYPIRRAAEFDSATTVGGCRREKTECPTKCSSTPPTRRKRGLS